MGYSLDFHFVELQVSEEMQGRAPEGGNAILVLGPHVGRNGSATLVEKVLKLFKVL